MLSLSASSRGKALMQTKSHFITFCLLSALAVSSAAIGDPARPEPQGAGGARSAPLALSEEFLVTAPRKLDEAISDFVDARAKLSLINQIGRWHTAPCPITRGLDRAQNDFVTARVKAVAAEIGAPRNEACAPN